MIEKTKKKANEPTEYKPICLIDTAGKLLESLFKTRLEKELNEKHGLHQFVFRAVENVVASRKRIEKMTYKNRGFCVLVTLDVENALILPLRGNTESPKEKENKQVLDQHCG